MRDALRRHRWAIAAIFVACWGLAFAWPQGVVMSSGGAENVGNATERYTGTYGWATYGWGVNGVFQRGENTWKFERAVGTGDYAPMPPAEARALVERRHPDAFGPEGWFVDWGSFALACCVAALFSVLTSVWWIGLRNPAPPGTSPGRLFAGALVLAMWPTLLGIPLALSIWRQLGRVTPPGAVVLDPELMIAGTVFLVSVLGVWLGRPRSSAA